MSDTYPNLTRLETTMAQRMSARDFVNWLERRGVFLAQHGPDDDPTVEGNMWRIVLDLEALLLEWQKIDKDELEKERLRLVGGRGGDEHGNEEG